VAIDLDELLAGGDRSLIDLLHYSVLSVQLEPLFVCLVRDYRGNATVARAAALFDVFLTASAPARIRAEAVLPPRDPRLEAAVRSWRERQSALAGPPPPGQRPVGLLPPRHLFDAVVAYLRDQPDGPLQQIALSYDPARTPHENLPGGRVSARGRFFLDNVWQPHVRPVLVAAGFHRVAAIG
jgi:hypothetical protein